MTSSAWAEFDLLASTAGSPSPWSAEGRYVPDFDRLAELLAVPVRLGAPTQSGLPAKALDVWIARELRRAGFEADNVWPRASEPRVVSREVARLLTSLPSALETELRDRLIRNPARVVAADARVLGRAYYKQVDVVMANWSTGPELLISTKRMDSSVSSNALNRIEESYGDAHNLRGRHPLAAIGYVLLTSKTALEGGGSSAKRLLDLVERLAKEVGGYDASCVIVADAVRGEAASGVEIVIDDAYVAPGLRLGRFFETIIDRVLDRVPIEDHAEARLRREPESAP